MNKLDQIVIQGIINNPSTTPLVKHQTMDEYLTKVDDYWKDLVPPEDKK